MSFRDRVTFSMVASGERQHKDRVCRLKKYQTGVLPIAAVYGGNASGKTNFFTALSFAKRLVVRGTLPGERIGVEPFRLAEGMTGKPSRFLFELLIDELIYEFSFAVTAEAIQEEKLVVINSASEKVLYHRRRGKVDFDASLAKDTFLQFAFKGTRDNQLFLTNAVSQKVDRFQSIYDWFADTLELLGPDSRFGPFEHFFDEEHPLYSTMNAILRKLDTGIARLGGQVLPLESLPVSEHMKARLHREVKDSVRVRGFDGNCFLVTQKNGELVAKKLVTWHTNTDGHGVPFEMSQESDGSRRVIDLLPAFLELSTKAARKVYVIDELDRSLHTLLARSLLEFYLANCSRETRTQLLLTTHDVQLMDQELLRRDEMWLAERDTDGSSRLFSFSDYKNVRKDKDIRKSYLQGRLGGTPRIASGDTWLHPGRAGESGEND